LTDIFTHLEYLRDCSITSHEKATHEKLTERLLKKSLIVRWKLSSKIVADPIIERPGDRRRNGKISILKR
jgi:hypothetical protein